MIGIPILVITARAICVKGAIFEAGNDQAKADIPDLTHDFAQVYHV
jgi:hypothetical protein